jgi:MYXO-CTERM domain-containing protein
MALHKTYSMLAAVGVLAFTASAHGLAEPHQSTGYLPTSNGVITAAFDVVQSKVDFFNEHPYESAAPNVLSRNFSYDTYPGIRVGTQVAWLDTIAPSTVEYLPGTGIVHVARSTFGVTIDEYDFSPMGLSQGALFTVVKVTRTSGSGAIDVYSLYNYHLGSGSPLPGTDSENIAWNAQRDAFYEWGPSGVAFGYGDLVASSFHGSTPNSPYTLLLAGQNLADDSGTGGATTDAVCGHQFSLGNLALGTPTYVGWYAVLAEDANAQSAIDAVTTFVASRTPDVVLSAEVSAWQAWQTAAPTGASTLEASLFQESQAMLRMGQVTSSDVSDGQILAAIAPGEWNITWVRDMAYSTVALARTGHAAEAKRALAFEVGAPIAGGAYQSYVGSPYQISVVRYYGNGTEWSDTNSDGPNIELDGFGLFLWALETYVDVASDQTSLATWWPTVKPQVADVLASLQETDGLIAPDSSIWEVHWDGQQEHFAYTTIAAARGLCAAAHLATKMGDGASAAKYLAAGQHARDAILTSLRAPDLTIGQSTESLAKGSGWLDAAVIDAISFGLIDPQKPTAQATLASIQAGLVPPSGRGFMRDQGGSTYDSSEWVFVDMRVGRALETTGQPQASADLLTWNVAQGEDNFGILSELHDPVTGDYAGAAPMVGFGAGAYVLSLLDRGAPVVPGCDAFAFEPGGPADAGPDASDAGTTPDATTPDAGGPPPPTVASGCGCVIATRTSSHGWLGLVVMALLWMVRRRRFSRVALVLALASVALACGTSASSPDAGTVDSGGVDASVDAPTPVIDVDGGACTTTFTFTPPPGTTASAVSVSGEWSSFASPGNAMQGPDAHGVFSAKVPLTPGWYAYKLIIDGTWQLDPLSTMRKYVSGVENSAVTVTDCYAPTLTLSSQTNAGGQYAAQVAFVPGAAETQLDATTVTATLRKDFVETMQPATASEANASIGVSLTNLASGKYTLFLNAKDRLGRAAPQLRLVFWIATDTFDWRDSLIYMVMTDRLQNGDTSNDSPPTPNVDPREDFHNGDLEGVQQVIASGALDKLGVNVLWLSPFNTNPKDAWLASDGIHLTTGYHGYWPTMGREVEPRFGGTAALQAVIETAHAHGMRVLMDFVIHHVHQEHEYVAAHPSWFTQGCICGTNNCDWTVHRLDCVFSTYLPNIDWTNPDASQQLTSDAVWWLDTFDLDGFRMDAVKQVPDAAVMNTVTAVRTEFEASGTRVFMTGETAMGWSDCDLSCNAWQYDLISHYIGPWELDGQFDFPLYYAVPMQVFSSDNHDMIHADYWTQASGWEYPTGSIMSPYIGSQDTPRFVTLATYRGQDSNHSTDIPNDQWTNVAGPPDSSEPYARLQVAMSWLLGLPGAPMIYYGDEYGEWGGVDPNNRPNWRGGAPTSLSTDEQATLALVQSLGQARKNLVALRRGDYVHVYANAAVLVFARLTAAGDVALVAVNRTSSSQSVVFTLPPSLGITSGVTLTDSLGGPNVTLSGQNMALSVPAWGQAILSPP